MTSVRGDQDSHGVLDSQAFSVSGKWQIAVAVLDNLIRRCHEKFHQRFKGYLWLITLNVICAVPIEFKGLLKMAVTENEEEACGDRYIEKEMVISKHVSGGSSRVERLVHFQ